MIEAPTLRAIEDPIEALIEAPMLLLPLAPLTCQVAGTHGPPGVEADVAQPLQRAPILWYLRKRTGRRRVGEVSAVAPRRGSKGRARRRGSKGQPCILAIKCMAMTVCTRKVGMA